MATDPFPLRPATESTPTDEAASSKATLGHCLVDGELTKLKETHCIPTWWFGVFTADPLNKAQTYPHIHAGGNAQIYL